MGAQVQGFVVPGLHPQLCPILPAPMRITVAYRGEIGTIAELDVEPTDTVKSVKQKIMGMHPPPEWANATVLHHRTPQGEKLGSFLGNKQRLYECYVGEGTHLRFAYAKNISAL